MIINLTFETGDNPTSSFETAVENAASMLDAAITSPITVNIDVGFGEIPGPFSGPVTNGEAEGNPAAGDLQSYADVLSALRANAAPEDPNFEALPNGATILGFNGGFGSPSRKNYPQVMVWPAEERGCPTFC